MILGPGPASGFSSMGGGGGMSSIFGLPDSTGCATIEAEGIGAALERLDRLRQAKTSSAMPSTKATATMAYFALPPDAGTPAGGRLEGGIIRKWTSLVRREAGRV